MEERLVGCLISDELVQEICSSWPRPASHSTLSSYHPQLRLHFKMIQGLLEVGSHTSLTILSAYAQPAARAFSRQTLLPVEATHHRLLARSILLRELASVAAIWCLPTNRTTQSFGAGNHSRNLRQEPGMFTFVGQHLYSQGSSGRFQQIFSVLMADTDNYRLTAEIKPSSRS